MFPVVSLMLLGWYILFLSNLRISGEIILHIIILRPSWGAKQCRRRWLPPLWTRTKWMSGCCRKLGKPSPLHLQCRRRRQNPRFGKPPLLFFTPYYNRKLRKGQLGLPCEIHHKSRSEIPNRNAEQLRTTMHSWLGIPWSELRVTLNLLFASQRNSELCAFDSRTPWSEPRTTQNFFSRLRTTQNSALRTQNSLNTTHCTSDSELPQHNSQQLRTLCLHLRATQNTLTWSPAGGPLPSVFWIQYHLGNNTAKTNTNSTNGVTKNNWIPPNAAPIQLAELGWFRIELELNWDRIGAESELNWTELEMNWRRLTMNRAGMELGMPADSNICTTQCQSRAQ